MSSSSSCFSSKKDSSEVTGKSREEHREEVLSCDLPLHDLKTLHFFYSVGMNYFRSFTSIPPPSMTSIPAPHILQPTNRCTQGQDIITGHTVTNVAAAAQLQTSFRPGAGIISLQHQTNLVRSADSDCSTVSAPLQQPVTMHRSRGPETTVSGLLNEVHNASYSTVHRQTANDRSRLHSPSEHEASRGKDASMIMTVAVSHPPEVSINEQQQQQQQQQQKQILSITTPEPNREDPTAIKKAADKEPSDFRSKQNSSQELSFSDIRKVSVAEDIHRSWDKTELPEMGPQSPADSGWTSDFSVGTRSISGSSVSDDRRHSSSSHSPPLDDAQEGRHSVGRQSPDSLNEAKSCLRNKTNHRFDGVKSALIQLEDQFKNHFKIENGAKAHHLAGVEGQSGGGGDGDDEDSLFSQPSSDCDSAKINATDTATAVAASAATVTDTASKTSNLPSTRQFRSMKSIPIRFQRLLEAEIERVSTLRQFVEGSPLTAHAVAMPLEGMFIQHPPTTGWVNIAPQETRAPPFTTAQCGSSASFSCLPLSSPLPSLQAGYQLQFASTPVLYTPVTTASGTCLVPTTTGDETVLATAAPFQPPPASLEYQTTCTAFSTNPTYDNCYLQPYFPACQGNIPTYVMHVDGVVPLHAENQPNFRVPMKPDNQFKSQSATTSNTTATASAHYAVINSGIASSSLLGMGGKVYDVISQAGVMEIGGGYYNPTCLSATPLGVSTPAGCDPSAQLHQGVLTPIVV